MSGDQIPCLPGKKRREMPGVYPGGMLKLRFDWYIAAEGMYSPGVGSNEFR